MATSTVSRANQQHVDRRWVLLCRRHLWLLIAIGTIVAGACAPLTRLRPYDPEKDFAYGMLEHQEPGDLMVVTRATLESHGLDKHALLLDTTIDAATPICTHVRKSPQFRDETVCVAFDVLQKWMEQNAPGR